MATEANGARRKFKNRGDLGKRKDLIHDFEIVFRHVLPLGKSFIVHIANRGNMVTKARARIANGETSVASIFDQNPHPRDRKDQITTPGLVSRKESRDPYRFRRGEFVRFVFSASGPEAVRRRVGKRPIASSAIHFVIFLLR
jgi:hypothetical protein